jgi:hypothetical protein
MMLLRDVMRRINSARSEVRALPATILDVVSVFAATREVEIVCATRGKHQLVSARSEVQDVDDHRGAVSSSAWRESDLVGVGVSRAATRTLGPADVLNQDGVTQPLKVHILTKIVGE